MLENQVSANATSHQRPKKSYLLIIKWFITGFFATLTLLIAAVALFIWQFSPLISVNEKAGRVKLLGGLIEVNSNEELHFSWFQGPDLDVAGSRTIDPNFIKFIRIEFANSKIELTNSDSNDLTWQCSGHWNQEQLIKLDDDTVYLGGDAVNARCRISIPNGLRVLFKAQNGKLAVIEPHFDLDVDAVNGNVDIEPAHDARYKYSLKVNNGRVDHFDSSNGIGAYKISVNLVNGLIGKG